MATDKKAMPKPTTLSKVTQEYMLQYIKSYGTDDDIKWFKDLCNNNIETKTNNLDGKEVKGINLKTVRKEFAKRFHPELLEKKKKTKSFLDLVNEL